MKRIFISFLALLLSLTCIAQTIHYSSTNGTAIKGYDPVAYFLQNKAIEGSDEFTLNWSDSKWNFSTKANLDSFKIAPEKYAPQYGGYCAYGCSENHKSPTDPNAWTILNNKLYLNYNLETRTEWQKKQKDRIVKADENWTKLNK